MLKAGGVVNVLKPPGMTSHQVVAYLRKLFGERAGHAGTLDPGAAGVLVVLLGKATRLSEFLLHGTKSYRVEVVLGAVTATGDAASPPVTVRDTSLLDAATVERAVREMSGDIWQVPPMTSALKFRGSPLYRLARTGLEVGREPRRVTIYEASLLEFWPGPQARALVDLTCSHGTYVRTWCADLGERLGVGGYMGFLVRTAVGPFSLEEALTLEEVSQWREDPGRVIQPMVRAVESLPAVELTDDGTPSGPLERLRSGSLLRGYRMQGKCALWPGTKVRVMGCDGALLAIAEYRQEGLHPVKVFV